ncbi:MAG: TonB-dependent hemoglobin/transferrin/lactoferrin family receptor [Wenzhouxiangella sp.]
MGFLSFPALIRPRSVAAVVLLVWLPAQAAPGSESAETEVERPADTILVTIGRVVQPEQQVIAPVSVLGREEIELRQASDLSDLLSDLPGVQSAQGPRPEALVPNIRGLGEGRVVMRIDGARQNMAIRHRAQTLLDPALLERVEILRGPASSLYGSGATGGVILFETLDAEGFLDPGASFGGQARLGYQSNNDAWVGSATLAAQAGDAGLITSVSRRASDDYVDGGGNPLNFTENDVSSGLVKGSWRPDEAQRLSLTYLGYVDDSPSLGTADRASGTVVDRSSRQQSTSLRYQLYPDSDLLALDAVVYWSDLMLDERPVMPGQTRVENSLSTVGVDIANSSRLQTGAITHTLTYGAELYRDTQRGLRDGRPAPQFRGSQRDTLGLFAQNRAELTERLDLLLGLRHDDIDSSPDEAELVATSFSRTSYQAGLMFDLASGWTLTASFNEAFRAPALRELFIGGQHFPGNFYVPNPDLQPESARNYELGLRFDRRGLWLDDDRIKGRLAVFRNDIDNFIEQRVRGSDAPAPLTNTTRFDNVGQARVEGLEVELDWRIGDYSASLFGARLRGDDRELGIPLESIPGDEIGLRLEHYLSTLLLGGQIVHAFAQDRVLGGMHRAQPTPSHTLIDLYATWQATPDLRISARIDNLADETYRRHLTLINQPGRSVKLQASYLF